MSTNLIAELAATSDIIKDPQEINSHVRDFFSLLYKSDRTMTCKILILFQSNKYAPNFYKPKGNLDKMLTSDELIKIISCMQSEKSPGPDTFLKQYSC